jgi:type IV pilus assembly protein PilM
VGFDISALLNPKARTLLGLDINSSAVKMVELSASGKEGFRVERYTVEVLPKDAVSDGNIANLEGVVDCVKRAWKRMGTSTRNVAMALPGSAVITKKIIVPAGLRDEELEAQVESEANQYIPFAIDEVNLDYQVIGPARRFPTSLRCDRRFQKERVEDRVAVADAAGLKAVRSSMSNPCLAGRFELMERQLPEGGKNQTIA